MGTVIANDSLTHPMNWNAGNKQPGWEVLLIGGHSASGKTTLAKEIGLALGRPWLMADDLRLAFNRPKHRSPTAAMRSTSSTSPTPMSGSRTQ